MTENSKKCQNAPTVRKLGTYLLFPLSYDRLNLIYLHGKSVFFGLKARGIQIWYYCNYILARLTSTGETLINNYLSRFPIIPAVPFNWQRSAAHITGSLLDLKYQPRWATLPDDGSRSTQPAIQFWHECQVFWIFGYLSACLYCLDNCQVPCYVHARWHSGSLLGSSRPGSAWLPDKGKSSFLLAYPFRFSDFLGNDGTRIRGLKFTAYI